MNFNAIILAAGKGTRMKSDLPKCAFPFFGKPMITYIINSCHKAGIEDICVVVGHKKEEIMKILNNTVEYACQEEQLGTGHAVLCAKDFYSNKDGVTLIFPGDMPLIDYHTINDLVNQHINSGNDLTVVTTIVDNPTGYGRIVRKSGQITKIVEEKDATQNQKQIKEINTGLYCINTDILKDALLKIKNDNSKHEYYLTDIIEILSTTKKVNAFIANNNSKLTGINDLYALAEVEKKYQQVINENHMLNGVHLINPDSILIEDTVVIEPSVTIDACSIIRGNTKIKSGTYIEPFSLIVDGKKIK